MSNPDALYAKYEAEVKAVLDKYMADYNKTYPDERNFDTGKEFMDKYYDDYRKEVARIAVDTMHEGGLDKTLSQKIINQNSFTIGNLFGEIMKASI